VKTAMMIGDALAARSSESMDFDHGHDRIIRRRRNRDELKRGEKCITDAEG